LQAVSPCHVECRGFPCRPALTTPRVYDFVDHIHITTSRATARKILTSLGSILEDAVRRGLHSYNSVRGVKISRTSAEDSEGDAINMPTKSALRAMLEVAAGRRRPLIVTATFTGMRASELRGLKWIDVDLKEGVIHGRRRVDHWRTFGAPKSKAGRRDIPTAPMVIAELRRWRLECPKGELDLVFPSPSGGILSHACNLKDGFGPIQIRAGITNPLGKPKFGLHALRHAAAAMFIEQRSNPKRIQTILGHASIGLTFDTYGYLFESQENDRLGMAEIERRLIG
jgi:integrase